MLGSALWGAMEAPILQMDGEAVDVKDGVSSELFN